ncbi:type I restriction endonuclease [Paraclostridium ghonii]|uniref:type I restriction endonuclease n=1 Tax=Paraclostridium ghonii TaxID=29358 RepID=UPI003525DB8B
MDFVDRIKQFSKRIDMVKERLATEEATKTALIMPFFNLLDYDVFNPIEFVPEFVADVGIKKGEKVDYAIINDGKPVILIEAKPVDDDLTKHDAQLFRYFTGTEAKFAVLTNGIIYKFFTDLEEPNKMDEKPFLEVDLLDLNDTKVTELKKFTKDNFDIDTIFNTASELKYTNLIKKRLTEQLNYPTDEFVRFIIGDFYSGVKTSNVVEKFRPIVKKSMQQFVNDFMNDKIKTILNNNEEESTEAIITTEEEVVVEKISIDENSGSKVVTTEEEIEGFNIVRSILSEVVSPEYIGYKDVERYCGILYQNNTRKWVCRLYFNSSKKSITISDENKKEIRYYIENISDIYKYKNELLNSIDKYIEKVNV